MKYFQDGGNLTKQDLIDAIVSADSVREQRLGQQTALKDLDAAKMGIYAEVEKGANFFGKLLAKPLKQKELLKEILKQNAIRAAYAERINGPGSAGGIESGHLPKQNNIAAILGHVGLSILDGILLYGAYKDAYNRLNPLQGSTVAPNVGITDEATLSTAAPGKVNIAEANPYSFSATGYEVADNGFSVGLELEPIDLQNSLALNINPSFTNPYATMQYFGGRLKLISRQ